MVDRHEDAPESYYDDFYGICGYDSGGENIFKYAMIMAFTREQAIAEFESSYMSAHNGTYGENVSRVELLAPIVNGEREVLLSYELVSL